MSSTKNQLFISNRRFTGDTFLQYQAVTQLAPESQLEMGKTGTGLNLRRPQRFQRSHRLIEQGRMRVVTLGPFAEQLGHIRGRVKGRQLPPQLWKPPHHLRLGEQVESSGRFAEEDYTAQSQ